MFDLQTVLTYLTLVSVPVGVFYHIMTLNNTRKNQQQQLETRQAQLFMNIYDTFSSKPYQKDRERMFQIWAYDDFDDFFNKYGPDVDPDEHAIWDMFCSHFEGIAVLVRRGLIDSQLVYDLMYTSIIMFWEKYETILLGLRERSGPRTWRDIEYLYNEMKRLQSIEIN
jgi:hypothetical protein